MSIRVDKLPVIAMLRGLVEGQGMTRASRHTAPAFEVKVPIKIPDIPRGNYRGSITGFLRDPGHHFSAAEDPGLYNLPDGWSAWRVQNLSRTVLATAVFDGSGDHRMTIINGGFQRSWTEIIIS